MPKAKPVANAPTIAVTVAKKQARYKRVREPRGPDSGIGEFFLLVDVTAIGGPAYIPLSIASGKKPTGFVYQIEGTAAGTISTANVSSSGTGVTQVTLGTVLYAKIPTGKTGTFRILIEIRGKAGKEYGVIVSRINYKNDPDEARYRKFEEEIRGKTIRFA